MDGLRQRQRTASYLLPDPGGEVVRELLDALESEGGAATAAERARCLAIVDELGRTHFGTANANLLRNRIEEGATAASPAAPSLETP